MSNTTINDTEPLRLDKEQWDKLMRVMDELNRAIPGFKLNGPTERDTLKWVKRIKDRDTGAIDRLVSTFSQNDGDQQIWARRVADIVDPGGGRYSDLPPRQVRGPTSPTATAEGSAPSSAHEPGASPDNPEDAKSTRTKRRRPKRGNETAGAGNGPPVQPGVDLSVDLVAAADLKTAPPFEDLLPHRPDVLMAIVESMASVGYDPSHPIVTWAEQDVVVDGHTRLAAAVKVGLKHVPAVRRSFQSEDEAVEYALHSQINRRNLSDSEILHLVDKLDELSSRGGDRRSDAARSKTSPDVNGRSSARTAAKIRTSSAKVEKARAVLSSGDAKILQLVKEDKLSLNQASQRLRKSRKPKKSQDGHNKPKGASAGQKPDEQGDDPAYRIRVGITHLVQARDSFAQADTELASSTGDLIDDATRRLAAMNFPQSAKED